MGFKVFIGFLKMVAGLVIGFVATGILISAALWHMVREIDRIDSSNGE